MNDYSLLFEEDFTFNQELVDVEILAGILRNATLSKCQIKIGSFILQGTKGITKSIQYSDEEFQMLSDVHSYTFPVQDGDIELSLQLYKNTHYHFRINCFSRCNNHTGQLFSMNLTTKKDAKGAIFFTQQIKFSERLEGDKEAAKAFRRMKQQVFAGMLYKLGYDIADTHDILLGVYDTKTKKFLNTTPEKFLSDLLTISILKGHFMGNKGYQLEILPSYNLDYSWLSTSIREEEDKFIPEKVKKQIGNRTIPLSLRFKVLERDRCCKLCGRSPIDGVKLHVDHIRPYSLGGTTIFENLQALCEDCNIGKSNKSSMKY